MGIGTVRSGIVVHIPICWPVTPSGAVLLRPSGPTSRRPDSVGFGLGLAAVVQKVPVSRADPQQSPLARSLWLLNFGCPVTVTCPCRGKHGLGDGTAAGWPKVGSSETTRWLETALFTAMAVN